MILSGTQRDKYLRICQEQLQRLSGLVEQILSMSVERRRTRGLYRMYLPWGRARNQSQVAFCQSMLLPMSMVPARKILVVLLLLTKEKGKVSEGFRFFGNFP